MQTVNATGYRLQAISDKPNAPLPITSASSFSAGPGAADPLGGLLPLPLVHCFLSVEPAAVYYQDMAVNIVAGGRCKKDGCPGQIVGVAPAAGGNAFEDLTGTFGVALEGFGIVGVHIAGRDGIDVDALGGPLIGECLSKLADATLGCSVRGNQNATLKGEQRGDVNDLA